jgi:hypothetical protein
LSKHSQDNLSKPAEAVTGGRSLFVRDGTICPRTAWAVTGPGLPTAAPKTGQPGNALIATKSLTYAFQPGLVLTSGQFVHSYRRRNGQFVQSSPGGDTPGCSVATPKTSPLASPFRTPELLPFWTIGERWLGGDRTICPDSTPEPAPSLEPSQSGPFGKAGLAKSGQIVQSSLGSGASGSAHWQHQRQVSRPVHSPTPIRPSCAFVLSRVGHGRRPFKLISRYTKGEQAKTSAQCRARHSWPPAG